MSRSLSKRRKDRDEADENMKRKRRATERRMRSGIENTEESRINGKER